MHFLHDNILDYCPCHALFCIMFFLKPPHSKLWSNHLFNSDIVMYNLCRTWVVLYIIVLACWPHRDRFVPCFCLQLFMLFPLTLKAICFPWSACLRLRFDVKKLFTHRSMIQSSICITLTVN